MKNYRTLTNIYLIALILFAVVSTAQAQTTAFNFQGRLNDGSSPANGRYDLQFKLFDAVTGGSQIGATIQINDVMLVNGVFSTQLDFGLTAFYNTATRFIEISLHPSSSGGTPNAFVILGPRQQILSVPFAISSIFAGLANSALHADNSFQADNAMNAANAANAQKLGGVDAVRFVQQDANGNVNLGGNLNVTGKLTQPSTLNGLPKAIILLDRDSAVIRCYNGITGASTGNCGFDVSHPLLGEYSIGFHNGVVPPRPIIVTTLLDEKATVGTVDFENGTDFRITVRYITTDSDNGKKTNAPLSVVVY